ncbi:MAG: hypothetical protein Q9191_004391 [Dirinaria sp. TL-2023a]
MQIYTNETISNIVVKLEGESKTRLALPDNEYDRRDRGRTELEVHKLLYKTAIVFPSRELQGAASPNANYTLPAGSHEYPFRFKIPFNNDCATVNSKLTNLNVAGLRLEMARDTNRHVKKTLPPSLSGFAGQAEIRYYVKVTVQRPAFYKENFRAEVGFNFLPIEPPRPPKNSRESYARRQHQFAPAIAPPSKQGLFRKPSNTPSAEEVVPPSIAFDGRLPDPAIITCNQPLPLRVLVTKLNESTATIFLRLIELVLVSSTTTRAHELQRNDTGTFVLMSRSNLDLALRCSDDRSQKGREMEIESTLWNQIPLPNHIAPTFDTCNLSRTYVLDIKVGLSWGTGGNMNPELMVQTIRMPVQVYSGIAPPQALLNAMANNPVTGTSNQLPQQAPQQPPPPFAPSDIADDVPPSYEDAIADELGPVDGPRREYEPPQHPRTSTESPEKRGWGERLFQDSGH